jgi:hypothetical protein
MFWVYIQPQTFFIEKTLLLVFKTMSWYNLKCYGILLFDLGMRAESIRELFKKGGLCEDHQILTNICSGNYVDSRHCSGFASSMQDEEVYVTLSHCGESLVNSNRALLNTALLNCLRGRWQSSCIIRRHAFPSAAYSGQWRNYTLTMLLASGCLMGSFQQTLCCNIENLWVKHWNMRKKWTE